MIELSVVVPAYNEKNNVKQLLDSFAAQTFPHTNFELVIVDNDSKDETYSIVEKLKSSYDFSIQLLKEAMPGANPARNKGGQSGKGTLLIFLDADNTVEPAFLAETVELMKKGYNAGAYYTKPNTNKWYDIALFWVLHVIKKLFNRSFGKSFVSKEIFDCVNGFDNSNILGMNVRFALKIRQLPATKYVICDIPVYASMRRFHKHGYCKTLWNWLGGYLGTTKKELSRKH